MTNQNHRHEHINGYLDEARIKLIGDRDHILPTLLVFIELLIKLQIYKISLITKVMNDGGMDGSMIKKFIKGLASYIGINLQQRFINKTNNHERSLILTWICFFYKEKFIEYFDNWMTWNRQRLEPKPNKGDFDLRQEILNKIDQIEPSDKDEEIIEKLSTVKSIHPFDKDKKNYIFVNTGKVNDDETTSTVNEVQNGEFNPPSLSDQTKTVDSNENAGEVNGDDEETTNIGNEVQNGEFNSPSLSDQTKTGDSYENAGEVNGDDEETTSTDNEIQNDDIYSMDFQTVFSSNDFEDEFNTECNDCDNGSFDYIFTI